MAIDALSTEYDGDYEAEEDGLTLDDLLASDNVAELLDQSELTKIGMKVKREFDLDEASRSDWLEKMGDAIDLAMQVAEKKQYPWPKAANVKYPLITTAAIQFAARAYPAIVSGTAVVKGKVVGRDKDGQKRSRASRISMHMSYQLVEEMEEWEEDTDKLLHILPIVGLAFRKSYFDPGEGRNVSKLVHPKKLVVNDAARSMETAPRITEILEHYPYEITERKRDGRYLDIKLPLTEGEDKDAPHEFLEQHRLLDLDDDDYDEPYVVTIHRDSAKVVRIVPRFDAESIRMNARGEVAKIEPIHYYTKYTFIPSPDGSFHDVGFGALLGPINESLNATINQMLDAGTLQNTGGGFIGTSLRLRGGNLAFRPGEYKRVEVMSGAKVADNVVPLQHPGPSAVLFNLLGLLLEAGRDIGSVKDVLTGDTGPNETATTTLARIEQGLKVFTAVYKRIYRALGKELKKLYRLNAIYLDEEVYYEVLDDPQSIKRADYATEGVDVVPVADPSMVTDMQKLGRAQFLTEFREDPMVNGAEILKRVFEAASIDEVEKLIVANPPPNPEMVARADELAMERERVDLERVKVYALAAESQSKIILNLAKAESEEAGTQINALKAGLDSMLERTKVQIEKSKAEVNDDGGRVRSVESPPDNPGGLAIPGGLPGADPTGVGAG